MSRRPLADICLRLVAAWAVLSLLGYVAGARILTPFLPLAQVVSDLLQPDFYARVGLAERDGAEVVRLTLVATREVAIDGRLVVPPGRELVADANVVHALVPVVLLFAVLAAWPVATWKARLVLLAWGAPLAAAIVAVTLPIQLAGLVDIGYQNHAAGAGLRHAPGAVYHAMVLLESGGRWLLPLVVGGACAALVVPPVPRPAVRPVEPPRPAPEMFPPV